MELHRGHRDLRLYQERSAADAEEFRSVLQHIVKNVDTILGTKSPEAVESVMTSLQTVEFAFPSQISFQLSTFC